MSRFGKVLAAMALSVAAPAVTSAQDDGQGFLFNTGLGRPVPALDGRAAGLGGAAIALIGANLSAVNPASLAGLQTMGVWGSIMPEGGTVSGEGVQGDVQSVIFPLGRLAISATRRLTVSVSFGAFLDQNGGVQFVDTLELSTGKVPFRETRQSDGGISKFSLEVASLFGGGLSLGVAAQFYRGETRLIAERAFDEEANFLPARTVAAIDYSGFGFAVGAGFQPIPEMMLGVTGSWGSKLALRNDSSEVEGEVDLPLTFGLGGSWQLTPDFLVALDFEWAGWSVANDDVASGAEDTWGLGGGIELRPFGTTPVFVRAGAHLDRFPFKIGGTAPSERAIDFGMGAFMGGGRARIDWALEFGKRGDAATHGVEESFTRLTVSLAVFGN